MKTPEPVRIFCIFSPNEPHQYQEYVPRFEQWYDVHNKLLVTYSHKLSISDPFKPDDYDLFVFIKSMAYMNNTHCQKFQKAISTKCKEDAFSQKEMLGLKLNRYDDADDIDQKISFRPGYFDEMPDPNQRNHVFQEFIGDIKAKIEEIYHEKNPGFSRDASTSILPNRNQSLPSSRRLWMSFGFLFLIVAVLFFMAGDLFDPFNFSTIQVDTKQKVVVQNGNDDGQGSFREALKEVAFGGTIVFSPQVTTVSLEKSLSITKNVTIASRDTALPLLKQPLSNSEKSTEAYNKLKEMKPRVKFDVAQDVRIFINAQDVSFLDLHFVGSGSKQRTRSLIITQSEDLSNIKRLIISHCVVTGFETRENGGFIDNKQGYILIQNSYIYRNKSSGDGGGAIYNVGGTITIYHGLFEENTAAYLGGAIFSIRGTVSLNNATWFIRNSVRSSNSDIGGGGAIAALNSTSVFVLDSSMLSNEAFDESYAGAIFLSASQAFIVDSVLNNNKSEQDDGHTISVFPNESTGQPSSLVLSSNSKINSLSPSKESINSAKGVQITGSPSNDFLRFVSEPTARKPEFTPDVYLGSLTRTHFDAFCQKKKSSTAVVRTSLTLLGCGQGDDFESFEDMNVTMTDVCNFTYPGNQHLMARVGSYWDPDSWQCFKNVERWKDANQKPIPAITDYQQKPEEAKLTEYCQKISSDTSAALIYDKNFEKPNAYQWKCEKTGPGATLERISMLQACRMLSNNSQAIDRMNNYNDAKSWECWLPIKRA